MAQEDTLQAFQMVVSVSLIQNLNSIVSSSKQAVDSNLKNGVYRKRF